MVEAAARRGYDLSPLRARQYHPADAHSFDLILAMDRENLADIHNRSPDPTAQIRLFRDAAPLDVPDPWFTGDFERTLDLIEGGARAILATLAADPPARA